MAKKAVIAKESAKAALDKAVHDAVEVLREAVSYNPDINTYLLKYPTARAAANRSFFPDCDGIESGCEKHTHLLMSDPLLRGETWGEFGMDPHKINIQEAKRCAEEIEKHADFLGVPRGPEHWQLRFLIELREIDRGVDEANKTMKNAFEIDFRKALRVLPTGAKLEELSLSRYADIDLMRSLFLLEAFQAELKLAAKAAVGDGYSMNRAKIEWHLTSAINFSMELGNSMPLTFYFKPQSHIESEFGRSKEGGTITSNGHYPYQLGRIIEEVRYPQSDGWAGREKWTAENLTAELKKMATAAEGVRQEIIDSFSLRRLNLKEGEKEVWVKTHEQLFDIIAKGCSCSKEEGDVDRKNPHRFERIRRMDNVLVLQCSAGRSFSTPSDSKVLLLHYDAQSEFDKIPSFNSSIEDIDYVMTHKDAHMVLSDGED